MLLRTLVGSLVVAICIDVSAASAVGVEKNRTFSSVEVADVVLSAAAPAIDALVRAATTREPDRQVVQDLRKSLLLSLGVVPILDPEPSRLTSGGLAGLCSAIKWETLIFDGLSPQVDTASLRRYFQGIQQPTAEAAAKRQAGGSGECAR